MKIRRHEDARGVLESLRDFHFHPKEVLVASNKKGTLKGLHVSPYRKLVYVSHGHIHDFFIDTWAPNKPIEKVLTEGQWILVPANAGHGFYCAEDSLILYFLEDEYDPSKERTIYWDSPEFAFEHIFRTQSSRFILSTTDDQAPYALEYDYVVIGACGFIGSHVVTGLRAMGHRVFECNRRLHDQEGLKDVLTRSRASNILCCAGISGKPTTRWSEDHETETFETNVLDVINLIRLCMSLKRHLIYMGSGMVYSLRDGARTESDVPDWTGSVYCRYRVMLEDIIRRNYTDHVLYLRVLYPCSFDGHKSCFYEKMLTRTERVHANRVSLTILPDLIPTIPEMVKKRLTGILNFVNPGSLTLPDMLNAGRVMYHKDSPKTMVSEVLDTAKFVGQVGRGVPDVLESVRRHLAEKNDLI